MNYENIVIIETPNHKDLYPFSIMHNSWEIRCGCTKIYEKYFAMFPKSKISFFGDKDLLLSFLIRTGQAPNTGLIANSLIIYGNVLPNEALFAEINQAISKNPNENLKFNCNGNAAAYYIICPLDIEIKKIETYDNFFEIDVPAEKVERIEYIWEAIDYNHHYIAKDLKLIKNQFDKYIKREMVYAVNPENIYLGEDVKIAPGVVLDASEGAIVIDDEAIIMPNAVILGPVYIGRNTIIKVGAKIYHNCSFGEFCKVGGELEATIIHSYSNKQHEGFLGHSYICEWVNLGADTNNSDLKNTYSNIVMRLPHKRVATNKMFIGLMAGDHTKSAINSQFTTGTVVGIHSNIFDSGFMPSQINSFTWGGSTASKHHRLEDAISTAETVMNRRNKELTNEEIELMTIEYSKIQK